MKKIMLLVTLFLQITMLHSQSWVSNKTIISLDIESEDWLGHSLAMSHNTIIIGAPFEDDLESGSSTLADVGALYVFALSEQGDWQQKQKIRAYEESDDERLGGIVKMSDRFAIASGRSGWDDFVYFFERENGVLKHSFIKSGETGQTHKYFFSGQVSDIDTYGNYAAIAGGGVVHILEYDGLWKKIQEIAIEGYESGAKLSLDIENEMLIIGSPSSSKGPDNTFLYGGVVYVYRQLQNGTWEKQQDLVAEDRDTYDEFGYSVKLHNNKLIIGAISDEDGIGDDSKINSAGSVYVFDYNQVSSTWIQSQKIAPHNRADSDRFGIDIDVSSSILVVGSMDSKVFIFDIKNNQFVESQTLTKSTYNSGFGEVVAINSKNLIGIGIPFDDTYGNNAGSCMLYSNDNVTDLSKVNIQSTLLYPNPTHGDITVELDKNLNDLQISIYDLSGRLILSKSHKGSNQVKLNIADCNPGTYLIIIESENYYSNHKLIIK